MRCSLFLMILLCVKVFSSPLISVIEAIDSENASQVIAVFNTIDSMNVKEAREFLEELYEHYYQVYAELHKRQKRSLTSFFPVIGHTNLGKNIGVFTPEVIGFGGHYQLVKDLIKPCIRDLRKEYSKAGVLNIHHFSSLLLMANDFEGPDLPTDLVVGGVEMLAGALICILPIPGARWLGGTLIADGLHRAFNGITEMDEQNKKAFLGTVDP